MDADLHLVRTTASTKANGGPNDWKPQVHHAMITTRPVENVIWFAYSIAWLEPECPVAVRSHWPRLFPTWTLTGQAGGIHLPPIRKLRRVLGERHFQTGRSLTMKPVFFPLLAAFGFSLVAGPTCYAEDWPQWRGPHRDGISNEKGWMDSWHQEKTPAVAWRAQVGKGHSAVSVSQGRAFTIGWDGRQDTVFCFDAASGKLIWKFSYPCGTIKQWPGPRCTPTIAGDRVYSLSQHGLLHALDSGSGKVIWKVQLPASYNPDVDYGFAWSPLVEGSHLILGGGKRGLALHTRDGGYAWGNDGQPGACASPVPCDLDGKRVVAVLANDRGENVHVVGVEPGSGKELWRSAAWPERWGAACIDPVISERSFFLTTAEQHTQCGRFTVNASEVKRDWSNSKLACYTGSCVLVNQCLFGVTKVGVLKCLDWKTGEERWSERGFGGHGAMIAAAGKLVVQTSQSGEVVVVDASAKAYEELRRVKVFAGEGTTFTAPVVANGRLYCRSYHGEVVCLATGQPNR
jgi:outer membrane protein assembly factor BamB